MTAAAATEPVGPDVFDAAMAEFGPFEPYPVLAVAVSGGPDSMALVLLADRWARDRGGSAIALTVDHGLRPDSAGEARTVGTWLAARGIRHRVLAWRGAAAIAMAGTGVQAAARQARYALLEEACRADGILHLLLGHSADDQAETVLLRLSRGSGPDGLAAMPACRELRDARLLRPLLGIEKARLQATCRAFAQDWFDDPSNAATRFARGRLRAAAGSLQAEGLSRDSLALSAARAGSLRAYLDGAVAAFLAAAATVWPEGHIDLDAGRLATAPPEIAARALARCLMTVSGSPYAPRLARLLDALARLRTARPCDGRTGGTTLGGCQIVALGPGPAGAAGCRSWRILREPAKAQERPVAGPGQRLWWDRRFLVGPLGAAIWERSVTVGRLDRQGGALLAGAAAPAAVRRSLPGLWRDGRLVGLPGIAPAEVLKRSNLPPFFRMFYAPATLLAGARFAGPGEGR